MAKPEREFTADVGQVSMGVAGPDFIERDFDKLFAMMDPNKTLPTGEEGGIGKNNLQQGAVDDIAIGNREIDDTQIPTGNVGFLSVLLNWVAYILRRIIGLTSWRSTPPCTLKQISDSTIGGVKNIGGDIGLVAGASIEITPDPAGKKVIFAAKNDSIIPGAHAQTHGSSGTDRITPESIGSETPTGAQTKVNTHENKAAPHSGHVKTSSSIVTATGFVAVTVTLKVSVSVNPSLSVTVKVTVLTPTDV